MTVNGIARVGVLWKHLHIDVLLRCEGWMASQRRVYHIYYREEGLDYSLPCVPRHKQVTVTESGVAHMES